MENILQTFGPQLIIIACVYALVLFVVFLDLWAGIRKAKQRGEYRSSYGLRKTVDKISRYFNMILVITSIDVVQMLAITQLNPQTNHTLPVLPFFTFIGAMFVGFIELKSIYENSEAKERAKIGDAAKILSQIIQHKDEQEIIAGVIEYLKKEKRKGATMKLTLKRRYFAETYIIGTLFIDGVRFCDTLEDKNRDDNRNGKFDNGEQKVKNETAIPFGTYEITVNRSPRFGRDLPRLLNVPHFDGILIHRGNTGKDTSGCILVGENKVKGRVINSTPYELELTKRCKAAIARKEKITIEIV